MEDLKTLLTLYVNAGMKLRIYYIRGTIAYKHILGKKMNERFFKKLSKNH